MTEWRDAIIDIAHQAGDAIMAVYRRDDFDIETKGDNSPLTAADLAANRVIVDGLRALTPDIPILSEEGKEIAWDARRGWTRFWLVDPLDGTRELIKRNGEFTVNIALMARDEAPIGPLGAHTPVGGVIHVPVKDTLYFAWQGGGAYRGAGNLQAADAYERAAHSERLPVTTQRDAYTIVASRSHPSPDTQAFIERMEQEHGRVETVSMGSALKICLVAEGAADVYPRYAPTMEWDTAAGHAIAREAGRDLTDVSTNARMRYNKQDLLNNWFIVQ